MGRVGVASGYQVKRSPASGGPYTTLATVASGRTYYVDPGLVPGTKYYYTVAAIDSKHDSIDSPQLAATADDQLFGTTIGTSGSFGSLGATKELAFDDSLANFFDGPDTVSWAGLDLGPGVSAVVTSVAYVPRAGVGARMVGGAFQGSSVADFGSDVTNLFTIGSAPPDGTFTTQTVAPAKAFRYLRYVSATGGFGNVPN